MKYLLVLMAFLISACNPTSYEVLSKHTVLVTNLEGSRGGSGVILKSTRTYSHILTNSHVCQGIAESGIITASDNKQYLISLYLQSKNHDLCLIHISTNLKINTTLTKLAPSPGDEVFVSGHPNLLPTIISQGHMSGRKIITVRTGTRACTEEELRGPEAIACILLGGLPEYVKRDAQVISALGQPGSSGSGVFNSRGQLIGLVFAGRGEIGYSYIVPYEYITQFLDVEVPSAGTPGEVN